MLLDHMVNYCDSMYKAYRSKCGSGKCNHPSGACSGSCYNCLYQIHYPTSNPPEPQKSLYDCPKMLNHYVCQYSYLYATELLCAFQLKAEYLRDFPYYHIMSLGCGGCADLMAFEHFYDENGLAVPVSYIGVDVNNLWTPINCETQIYCENRGFKYQNIYADAFEYFSKHRIDTTNVIVISYMISYLYNTGQISTIDDFFENLVQNVICRKTDGKKMLIVINDVNSYKRGRDFFFWLKNKIDKYSFERIVCTPKYFDTGDLFSGQMIGTPYSIRNSIFPIPSQIQACYHAQSKCQKTFQLILEVS